MIDQTTTKVLDPKEGQEITLQSLNIKDMKPATRWEDVTKIKTNKGIFKIEVVDLDIDQMYKLQHFIQSWYNLSCFYLDIEHTLNRRPGMVSNLNIVDEHHYINSVKKIMKSTNAMHESLGVGEKEIVDMLTNYYKAGKIKLRKELAIVAIYKKLTGA